MLVQIGGLKRILEETVSLVHIDEGKANWRVSIIVLGVSVIVNEDVAQIVLVPSDMVYGMVEGVNVGPLTEEPVPKG